MVLCITCINFMLDSNVDGGRGGGKEAFFFPPRETEDSEGKGERK